MSECLTWGFFAALVVPIVLVLTGGSMRTAAISGVATAGLTATILVVVRMTGLRLPNLDGPVPQEPIPPNGQPRPAPPVPRWEAFDRRPQIPHWQQPPSGEWDPFEPTLEDDRRRYRRRAP